jgi:hypothetical protein
MHEKVSKKFLLSEVKRLTADLEQATRERDAAIDDLNRVGKMAKDCQTCDMANDDTGCTKRYNELKNIKSVSCWKWRGPDRALEKEYTEGEEK